MTKPRGKIKDIVLALLLAVALIFSASFLANRIHNSKLLTQSRIFRSFMKDDSVSLDFKSLVMENDKRKVLIRFIIGLSDAYVSFELIPYNEGGTFAVVMNSWVEGVDVKNFLYHRKDLEIRGVAETPEQYATFLERLSTTGYFEDVTGSSEVDDEGEITFQIYCQAKETAHPAIFGLELP